MNKREDNILLARTVDEIVGAYRPGHAPILYYNESVDHDSILAHEGGHRQLCNISAMGLYISGLSLATTHAPSADQDQLRSAIQSLLQQCWMCQEGYATFRQLARLRMFGKINESKQLIESLPESYMAALRIFDLDTISNRAALRRLVRKYPKKARKQAMWLALEHVASVIGRSAMSVPLAELLGQSTSLPNYEVLVAVRDDPPDVRLNRIITKCDAEFVSEVAENFFLAMSEVLKSNTSRALDERMDNMAQKLCGRANVAYEPSYVLDAPQMYTKLGLKNFCFVDQRDVSLAESLAKETDSRIVQRNWHKKSNVVDELTVDDVAIQVNALWTTLSSILIHSGPDIVCELLPIRQSGAAYYPVFHIFSNVRLATDRGEFNTTALLNKTVPQCQRTEEPAELPNRIFHRSWTWVMHWSMFKAGSGDLATLPYKTFAETGAVYSPLLLGEQTPRGHFVNSVASTCYSLIGDSSPTTVSGSEAMITEYIVQGVEPRLIVVKPINPMINATLPVAPDVVCRVAYALSEGAYSLLTNLLTEGSHE